MIIVSFFVNWLQGVIWHLELLISKLLGSKLLGYGFEIAIVSETHFKKWHKEEVCLLAEFQTFHQDRKGRSSRRVVIYVQDQMEAREHQLLSLPEHIDLLWVEIRSRRGITWVGALYHPPKSIYKSASLYWDNKSCRQRCSDPTGERL